MRRDADQRHEQGFVRRFPGRQRDQPGVSQNRWPIEMFTATGALSDNAPWGDIQRVTYELKTPADRNAAGKDLYRSVTRNLLTVVTTPDVEDQLMLSGVASIKFSCFDGTQWQDTWDTTGPPR
jgi:hypothetical protein